MSSLTPPFKLTMGCLLVLVLIVLGLVGRADYEDQVAQYDHYCDMVQLYKISGGKLGWPPYQGACDGTQQQ